MNAQRLYSKSIKWVVRVTGDVNISEIKRRSLITPGLNLAISMAWKYIAIKLSTSTNKELENGA
jgi:hypothetical protein